MAARLAVCFVAAATIAGAAWAQAGPPTAQPSALNAYRKLNKQVKRLKTSVNAGFGDVRFQLGDVKTEISGIRGELGSYLKSNEADARYLKSSEPVVHGNGSVFSASTPIPLFTGKRPLVMAVPDLLTIEAENGKPALFYVVNQTGAPLSHTACGGGLGGGSIGGSSAGITQPGQHFHCPAGVEPSTVQLFGEGAEPIVVTLTVSAIPVGQSGDLQYTTQILVGT